MAYFKSGKGKPAPTASDIPNASSIRGIGVLGKGAYKAVVETVSGGKVMFSSLPDGTHIESLPGFSLSKGEKVGLTIGLSKGACLRRNAKGEYALVNAQDKEDVLTAWHANVMNALSEGSKISLAYPAIKYIEHNGTTIYTNDEVFV